MYLPGNKSDSPSLVSAHQQWWSSKNRWGMYCTFPANLQRPTSRPTVAITSSCTANGPPRSSTTPPTSTTKATAPPGPSAAAATAAAGARVGFAPPLPHENSTHDLRRVMTSRHPHTFPPPTKRRPPIAPHTGQPRGRRAGNCTGAHVRGDDNTQGHLVRRHLAQPCRRRRHHRHRRHCRCPPRRNGAVGQI